MAEVKRLGVFSIGKVFAVIGLLTGLIMSGLYFYISERLGAQFVDISPPSPTGTSLVLPNIFPQFSIIGFILTNLMFTLTGFVIGCLTALLYNLIAKEIGGFWVEFR